MKNPFRTSILLLGTGFLVLFSFRLITGYIAYPSGGSQIEQVAGSTQTSFNYEGKNYASGKPKSYKKEMKSGSGSSVPLSVEQKYEKVGTVALKSKDYESDEGRIRESIEKVEGLIQYEQSSGLEGRRSLHLAIGVVPERFDELIAALKSYGTLASIRIDKVDKTNEYKMLQAKRATLETTRESLGTLKELGTGSIEELIRLEEKISETESQIQDLGVNLGDYDAENEFCTVKCSLLETVTIAGSEISFAQRIKVALEWTVGVYLKLVVICLLGTTAIWLALLAFVQIRKIFPTLKTAFEP